MRNIAKTFRVGGNWGEMGGKWGAIPLFHSHMLPIFLEVKDLPRSSLCKIKSPDSLTETGRSLTGKKKKEKVFRYQFSQKSPRALHVLNHGWWRLAVGGWRRLAAVGSWRLVVAGGWRRLVVGGWWRLAVGGSWRLAVGGPLGRSIAKKKKSGPLRTALDGNMGNVPTLRHSSPQRLVRMVE